MSSTYAYTALSPDYADLAQPTQGKPVPDIPSSSPSSVRGGKWTRVHDVFASLKSVYQRNVGLLLVVASQMFFSLMNVAVKKLNGIDPPVSALELIVVRMVITLICSITYMLSTGVPDPFLGPKGVRLLLVFRGFTGFFGLIGIYYSLQYLSLSDATVLTFLAPLCTAAAGALCLGEKFARREAFAGILSLVGVLLIARPPFLFGGSNDKITEASQIGETTADSVTPNQRLIAVGVAMLGVLGSTGAYTSLRAIGKRAHPLHSLVSFSTYCVVVAAIGMLVTKSQFIVPNRLVWLAMLVMIGLFGFAAQIVFATILERIFFHVVPSVLSVVGTLTIITCAMYVALTKEASSTPESDKSTITLRAMDDDSLESGLLEHASEDEGSIKRSGQ
ncbi:hypothetical protein AGABI1DRAFT_132961 [Agaricus bisporus var. burnettii JB137-S8]|uniref:EamA domain-containing protein n=1 Tax=Agaricus bisporus var. burnettii (strain JB137-S8 / ATCC MYA-4627 / FGSC 10392) TaxID=597362 RepID=K5VK48_AGABU|nr:uncharacterized protein AGABI1DRAFT_132961 [Agaricus bisporus var. burnettii JB137-S8]EKM74704.1 hypothetical protein AGABI1DRAFT_132961 [Agaricus bisporus var. burnettii JB137-S8]